MHGDQQGVLVFGFPYELPANERASFQVERGAGLLGDPTIELTGRVAVLPQIMFQQMEAAVLDAGNALYRFPVDGGEARS